MAGRGTARLRGGSGPGSVNNWDYDLPTHVTQHDGVLDILTTKDPVTGMNQGTLETYPTTSGVVSSYGNMEFTGGLLQISMKAPAGDGAWPSLWLMPGAGSSQGDSFEIDIQEGGYTGKGNPNQAFTWHLHGPGGSVGGTVDSGIGLRPATTPTASTGSRGSRSPGISMASRWGRSPARR